MSYQVDHRQLADEMEIFYIDEMIGAGLPLWLPNGVALRDELENFMKILERKAGYQRVVSPHLAKKELYEKSGHLRAFKENMYPPLHWPEDQSEYYLRPMNCPHHHRIFSSRLRSYRQLPLRLAEYGQVYRYENSGSLRGLSRVRGLCQNDAHIYVDPEQCADEVVQVLELHERSYGELGLKNYRYRLSKRDPSRSDHFDGDAGLWEKAEDILRQALKKKNLEFFEAVGEAAFYGPKIDVQMKMGSGEESMASIQVDFNSAEKLNLNFVNSDGKLQKPWIIHRAPLGSHERFVAMLLEYYNGQLPGWLAPVQIVLLPLDPKGQVLANNLMDKFREQGFRAHCDHSQGSLAKRLHFIHRLRPFVKIVVGEKEVNSGQFHLQLRDRVEVVHWKDVDEQLRKF